MHTVRWMPLATEQLLAITLSPNVVHRSQILRAVAEIDTLLANDPHEAGESRDGPRRVLFVPPLGVEYRIVGDDEEVQIVRAWRFETHSDP